MFVLGFDLNSRSLCLCSQFLELNSLLYPVTHHHLFILNDGSANHDPRTKSSPPPFLWIKFYWNIATPINLHILQDCFCIKAELSSCDRECVAHRAKNIWQKDSVGFPGGAVDENPPANAGESACQCRGHRFEPWSGKIPHATEQLSSCATTTEPAL